MRLAIAYWALGPFQSGEYRLGGTPLVLLGGNPKSLPLTVGSSFSPLSCLTWLVSSTSLLLTSGSLNGVDGKAVSLIFEGVSSVLGGPVVLLLASSVGATSVTGLGKETDRLRLQEQVQSGCGCGCEA